MQWAVAAAGPAEADLPAAAAAPHPAATAAPTALESHQRDAADWPQSGKRWAPPPAGFSTHVLRSSYIPGAEHGAV
jgi:hypothetical protein